MIRLLPLALLTFIIASISTPRFAAARFAAGTRAEELNRSINETLPRSILTHATTLAATLALLIFAGEVIRPFAWIMAFGIFTGTFSSIYVAGALLLWIERKWPRAASVEGKGTARAMAEERRRARETSAVAGR